MLWMLGRAAWQARVLAHRRPAEVLDADDLVALVKDDCGLKGDLAAVASVKLGLLLALQVDPRGDGGRILFGHRSFAEYLGARHWDGAVRRALKQRSRREESIKTLGFAPVAVPSSEGDRLFEFLVKLVSRWPAADQGRLHDWTIGLLESGVSDGEFHEQTGWQLRRSLLSVASSLDSWPGWTVSEMNAPRALTLLLWPQVVQRACRLTCRRVFLSSVHRVSGLDLSEIDLAGASIAHIEAYGTLFYGANLTKCDLSQLRAYLASFRGATLNHACLAGANLFRADFSEADLQDCDLSSAELPDATFPATRLIRANLSGSNCINIDLWYSDLSDAILSHANLNNTDLSGATLYGADLTGATLTKCNFGDPENPGNNPITLWDDTTRWPEGFTPPVPPTPQTPKPS